jgi:hypothetical protein
VRAAPSHGRAGPCAARGTVRIAAATRVARGEREPHRAGDPRFALRRRWRSGRRRSPRLASASATALLLLADFVRRKLADRHTALKVLNHDHTGRPSNSAWSCITRPQPGRVMFRPLYRRASARRGERCSNQHDTTKKRCGSFQHAVPRCQVMVHFSRVTSRLRPRIPARSAA